MVLLRSGHIASTAGWRAHGHPQGTDDKAKPPSSTDNMAHRLAHHQLLLAILSLGAFLVLILALVLAFAITLLLLPVYVYYVIGDILARRFRMYALLLHAACSMRIVLWGCLNDACGCACFDCRILPIVRDKDLRTLFFVGIHLGELMPTPATHGAARRWSPISSKRQSACKYINLPGY